MKDLNLLKKRLKHAFYICLVTINILFEKNESLTFYLVR